VLSEVLNVQKLDGKVITVIPVEFRSAESSVGKKLQELRNFAEMTQVELAGRMQIGQESLAHIENCNDVNLSTLKGYVEALGATLRIDVGFSSQTPFLLSVEEHSKQNPANLRQLVLPFLDVISSSARRDVILSIKPEYSSKIIQGMKTVELRRRFPINVPKGTIAYIYSTTPDKALVGWAKIADVDKVSVKTIWARYAAEACIKRKDFDLYFSGLQNGYVLKFEEAHPFERELELTELKEKYGFRPPQSFLYAKPLLREALEYECLQTAD
jgi:predicted transcriptional regulator/DNA-binding XRE family transcriptional regulator